VKLYLGSRTYRPEGFLSVDIDAAHEPDIVADITDLQLVEDGSVEEIFASHVLEHLPWPLAFRALGEWTRVLQMGGIIRIGVPDVGMLASMIVRGINVWRALGMVYGLGRLQNHFEAHQFGYTSHTLLLVLRSLGFAEFDWWEDSTPGAQNGWMLGDDGERIAISLNVRATRMGPPLYDVPAFAAFLMKNIDTPFDRALANHVSSADYSRLVAESDPMFLQRIHYRMIEYRQRAIYLEGLVRDLEAKLAGQS